MMEKMVAKKKEKMDPGHCWILVKDIFEFLKLKLRNFYFIFNILCSVTKISII